MPLKGSENFMSNDYRVDYNHDANLHTTAGAEAALAALLPRYQISSLLDVGAGNGTWLRAAQNAGIKDLQGVDGLQLAQGKLHVLPDLIGYHDLNTPMDLGRKFDLVISLEVAEHIEPENAHVFVDNLVHHGDIILFAAACPGQPGTHHVNCQWPAYWQEKFNAHGFVCSDWPREKLWDNRHIEPWYRQNMFEAKRDAARAGSEPRLRGMIHPDLVRDLARSQLPAMVDAIERGSMPVRWYATSLVRATGAKIARRTASLRG